VACALVVASLAPLADAQEWLRANIHEIHEEDHGAEVATITSLYEIDTADVVAMLSRTVERVSAALGDLPVDYIEMREWTPLTEGTLCTLSSSLLCDQVTEAGVRQFLAPGIGGMSVNGSLEDVNVEDCEANIEDVAYGGGNMSSNDNGNDTDFDNSSNVSDNLSISDNLSASDIAGDLANNTTIPWMSWDDDIFTEARADEFDALVSATELCVNAGNTNLMSYPSRIDNVYVTGYRDYWNTHISSNSSMSISFLIWVQGVIDTRTAKFLNAKFGMNNPASSMSNESMVIPFNFSSETNISADFTDHLHFMANVSTVNQHGIIAYLPICVVPAVAMKGCMRITHSIFEHTSFTEYHLRYLVGYLRHIFTVAASATDPLGEFNVSEGPWPNFTWLVPTVESEGPWKKEIFPQFESSYDETCIATVECSAIPIAPLPRYLHSAVIYFTWEFEVHAKKFLCADPVTKVPVESCDETCLTNLTCLGGEGYWQGNFYFRSTYFDDDDSGLTPMIPLEDQDCPDTCCRTRRFCLRSRDVLGYTVPFSSPMMLVFGGRTFNTSQYFYDEDGTPHLIFQYCERLSSEQLLTEWQMCSELATNDLWRYDIARNKWDFLKPDSAISETTGERFGQPSPRYGHAAAIVEIVESSDTDQKRMYMYIYGGIGPYCTSGVCTDVWRYEIPFAAQAYYPKLADEDIWKRGNMWEELGEADVGGRYRHSMVATSTFEYIFVYGGQGIGRFYSDLIKYRVSTDVWEFVDPDGRFSLTRLMYDYAGSPIEVDLPTEEYIEEIDVNCYAQNRTDGAYAHCAQCTRCGLLTAKRSEGANMPTDRGDFSMVVFADPDEGVAKHAMVMFGGYRTTWGSDYDEEVCYTTTTTTIAPPTITTTTMFGDQALFGDVGGSTQSPGFTGTTVNSVVGTFPWGYADTTVASTTAASTTTSTVTTTYAVINPFIGGGTTTTTAQVTSTVTSSATETNTIAEGSSADVSSSTEDPALYVTDGGQTTEATVSNSSGGTAAASSTSTLGTGSCQNQYYFDDLWIYRDTTDQWVTRPASGTLPPSRRGHTMIARRAETNDTQLVLFGGHYQDVPYSDMWILDLSRTGDDGEWFQIDPYIQGDRPPSIAYHTMVYDHVVDVMVMFGGLHWLKTNASNTDTLRNADRRCFKDAQGLPESYNGWLETDFLKAMKDKCQATDFCCQLTEGWPPPNNETIWPPKILDNQTIRTDAGSLDLTNISTMCRSTCSAKQFQAEFSVEVMDGVWKFDTNKCVGGCSGNGVCEMSQCICQTEWYGVDCSMPRCPGSTCYTHPKTREQFCVECSQHGKCVRGACVCLPGWGFDDCSAYLCEDNCSSTPTDSRGVCVEDFPVHQCHCFPPWGGHKCDELNCLNECSGRGTCTGGVCQCEDGFYGDDCSVYVISIVD
jgi:hypothetical protein